MLGGDSYSFSAPALFDDLIFLFQHFSQINNKIVPSGFDDIPNLIKDMLLPDFNICSGTYKLNSIQIRSLKTLQNNFNAIYNNNNNSGSSSSQPPSSGLQNFSFQNNESIYITKQDITGMFSSFKSELLNSLNQVNSNNNHQNKHVTPQSFSQIGVDDTIGFKLDKLFEKKIRYNNHINNFKTHLENNTTPAALFYCRFPNPLLWSNPEFVKMHNARVKAVQEQFIKQDIEFLEKEIRI